MESTRKDSSKPTPAWSAQRVCDLLPPVWVQNRATGKTEIAFPHCRSLAQAVIFVNEHMCFRRAWQDIADALNTRKVLVY